MRSQTLTRLVLLLISLAASTVGAQAEVAPAGYEPPRGASMSKDPGDTASAIEAQKRRWIIAVQPRLVIAISDGNGTGLPRVGFGGGVTVGRALLVLGRARFGLGISFAYERIQRERRSGPSYQSGDTTQSLTHASFSLDLRLDGFALRGRLRPWATLGPALSIAAYADPSSSGNPAGLSESAILAGLRAALGFGVEVSHGVEVGLRGECLATFSNREFGTPTVKPFSPGNFSVGIDVGFRF